MPARTLTPEQRQAVVTRDVSVALSAGAGCGKTHVLTERFLSHLDRQAAFDSGGESVELRQLIAITFTDAAAREMRSRIREACYERLRHAESSEQRHYWQRLVREIDTARISTIHAFCAALLRAHATVVGLDPTFRVLDQGDADVLQYNVIDDVLRQQLTDLDSDTLDLAAAFGLARLKEQMAVLLGERNNPCFHTWQTATPEEIASVWQQHHECEAFPNALREIAAGVPPTELLGLLSGISPTKPAFCEARGGLLELLPKLGDATLDERELLTLRELARVQGICTAKDWPATEAFHQYRDICKKLRELIDANRPHPFDLSIAREAARYGLSLLRLTAKVAATYAACKAAIGQLDFDDLLSQAHALITDPQNAGLRERLAGDLRLLLVDEFQDTDRLQSDLVRMLCGAGYDSGRLFFVGDYKQSIYRFRGAAPQVFRDMRGQLAERGRLPLNVNFRSQPAVVNFVNALFSRAFDGDGQTYEPLRPNRLQCTTPPAVEFLWTITPNKNTHAKGSAEAARREEARTIAQRLRTLIDAAADERPIVDRHTGEPRPVRPGDVAILFRALSDVRLYEEALREFDLPYYLVGGHAFYAQQEVYDVLNLLRAVSSTADELSLAGALRSPFFSLADETLFWLVETTGSLNAGLQAVRPPAQLSAEESAKVTTAAETLHTLRAMKDRVPIAALLDEALKRTGYDAVLLAEFLGERKLANLHKLLERARAGDSGITDLDGFITQLAQFISRQPKEALASTLPETADVIRLMTIHHAKGLEFPLVIVPDLDRPPHISPPSAALHPDLGPLVPWPVDDDRKVSTGMTLFSTEERREELEERKRLLYVACTRAADFLILSTSLAAPDQPKSDWMKLLAERFDLDTGAMVGELPPGFEEPHVRVISEPPGEHQPGSKSRGPDLVKLLDEARQLAADGSGVVPPAVRPIAVDQAARRQFSFSQLTGQLAPVDAVPESLDDEIREPKVAAFDARGLGNLVHDVLSRIDLAGKWDLAGWCRHLAPEYVSDSEDVYAARACEMLSRFVVSDRARQMKDAKMLHREAEFLLTWLPKSQQSPDDEFRYIRGFIDCLYQDAEGGWHLVDFKTNDITAASVRKVGKQYELQLGVYALAAEQVLGQSPVELVLHFLQPGSEHEMSWNAEMRGRIIEQVNQSIAAMSG